MFSPCYGSKYLLVTLRKKKEHFLLWGFFTLKNGQTSGENVRGKHEPFGLAPGKDLWNTFQSVC